MFKKLYNWLFTTKKPKYYVVFKYLNQEFKISIFEENYIPSEKILIKVDKARYFTLTVLEIKYLCYDNLKEVLIICSKDD